MADTQLLPELPAVIDAPNVQELDWENGVGYDDYISIGENGATVFMLDGIHLYTSQLNDNVFKLHFIEAPSVFPEDYTRFRGVSTIAVNMEDQKIIPLPGYRQTVV